VEGPSASSDPNCIPQSCQEPHEIEQSELNGLVLYHHVSCELSVSSKEGRCCTRINIYSKKHCLFLTSTFIVMHGTKI
jgi:hypothetical protein